LQVSPILSGKLKSNQDSIFRKPKKAKAISDFQNPLFKTDSKSNQLQNPDQFEIKTNQI